MRAGELCAGYGGLAIAIEEVFSAETAWFSEFDAAPSKILNHHWPDVPNHGDMTQIDWAAIEQVDIISGGTPCQDLSHAGKRKGMTEGTRSNLWVHMREAIATQQPKWVGWENVRGAYSAEASSDVEFCPGCMGRQSDCHLRALGRVLGDLSDLGYDAQWRGLQASDVGAPHARFRLFILARRRAASDASSVRGNQTQQHHGSDTAPNDRPSLPDKPDRNPLRPRPVREAAEDAMRGGSGGRSAGPGAPRSDNAPLGPGEGAAATNTSSPAIRKLAGGPSAEEAREGSRDGSGSHRGEQPATEWGPYEPAIRRWEARLGRPAPRPTQPTGRDRGERLSPRFTEWMMGIPDGWVTDPAIGVSRNDQLKACGNGVVPQQAIAAFRDMLAAFENIPRKE